MREKIENKPATVVAVRTETGRGWRLMALSSKLAGVEEELAQRELAGAEYRLMMAGQNVWSLQKSGDLLRQKNYPGWTRWEDNLWFPMTEPLPQLPGEPVPSEISLRLTLVAFGHMNVHLTAAGRTIDIVWDDLRDSLELLVTFVRMLEEGGFPHAHLAEHGHGLFAVQEAREPDLCRLHVVADAGARGGGREVVDLLVARDQLVAEFKCLCRDIRAHPGLGHHFLCHMVLDDDAYGPVCDEAEAEWKRGVREGRFPDTMEAEDAYVAARITAGVTLHPSCVKLAEDYRHMLETLEIPPEWVGSHAPFGTPTWMKDFDADEAYKLASMSS